MQTEMNKIQTDQILKVPKNTARKKCKNKTMKCQMNGQIHEQYSLNILFLELPCSLFREIPPSSMYNATIMMSMIMIHV